MTIKSEPLVYSCSGCSNVAQLANSLAIRLDRAGVAEMSCIAGVGGGVPALVRIAQAGRRIIAIDGCKLHCALACLKRIGVNPDQHVTLSDYAVRKRFGEDCTAQQAEALYSELVELIGEGTGQPELAE